MIWQLFISLVLIIALNLRVDAQDLFNNGMTISIKSNTTFSVGENATNNGTIINNGSFLISGAWLNNGVYDAGTGDFTLNSPGDQIVNHNAQSFERLIIRGGGNKIFQADITINDNIDLQDGVLLATNEAKLIMANGALITGGSSSSYIAGPLYMYLAQTSFYPIGTPSEYLPVTLTNVNATNALVGYEALSPNPIAAFDNVSANVISSDHAWLMTVQSGTYNSAIITLPILNQSYIETISNAIVMEAPTSADEYISLGQSASSGDSFAGTVTSLETAMGRFFTLGYLSESSDPSTEISVVNAITPATQDGKHDFLKIENIEQYPINKVSIYNRWGDLLYETSGYDNSDVIFTGESNVGSAKTLDNGTYFYAIEAGGEVKTGFFVIRR